MSMPKFFEKIYTKKSARIIKPLFRKFQKDLNTEINDIDILQYSNDTESYFSIRKNNFFSEIKIRPINFSKASIEIVHNGLGRADNSKKILSLQSLTDEIVTIILEKFKKDFLSGLYKKNES